MDAMSAGGATEENEIPMDVRNINYGSGRKLTPEERKERRRKRREERLARGESVGDSDDSQDDFDDDEAEEIQEGLTEMKVPKLNLGHQLLETDIDAAEDLICPRKVRFDQAAPPGIGQAGSVLSTPRSVTADELEARLEDLRRQTDRILYVLDCMDTRLGGPGLVRGLDAPKLPLGTSMHNGNGYEGTPGPISPGSSFRSQAQDSIGPEIASHDTSSYPSHKIPGSAFSLPPGSNGRSYGGFSGTYAPGQSTYSPAAPTSYPSGSYTRPIGFVGFSPQNSRWGPLGKGSGLGVLADPGMSSPKMSEVQYIEQQTQCLLRDLEALQSIVIPTPSGSFGHMEPRVPQVGQRSPLRRSQSLRAPRSSRGRSYGCFADTAGPANNSLEYLTSLIQIRRSVVGVTDRLRPMDHLIARGRR